MRRDKIVKAVNNLKEALNAAQIRDVLRVARNGQQGEGVNRTQRILIAYNTFSQHYKDFSADEKQLMAFFGLDPLVDVTFWSNLIEGEQASSRKLLSDVDVGAYNVSFVMPKVRDLLAQDNDRDALTVTDGAGAQQEMKRVRVLVVEKENGLTEPSAVIAVVRSMTELYDALSSVYGANGVSLAIGSIDSGGAKAFDFFGAVHVMEALDELFANAWKLARHGTEENLRYQIEMAMMASGFVARVKEAQNSRLVSDDQGQRLTRLVAKAVETLLRNGGYTEAMDDTGDGKASLTPLALASKPQLLEFKEEARVDSRRDDVREAELEPLTAGGLAASGSYGATSISAPALNGSRYPDNGLAANSLNGGGYNGSAHNGSGLNGSVLGGPGAGGSGIGGDNFGAGGLNGGGSGRGGAYYGSPAYGASPPSPSPQGAGGAEQLYRSPSPNSRDYRDNRDALKDLKDIFGSPSSV